jgi:hypothetical protein
MNKKILMLVGLIALVVGGASTIALQSHAQKASDQSGTTSTPTVTTPPSQENKAGDTDNIQDQKGGVEKPDTAISGNADKETNDGQDATSTVKQGDAQEHGENNATSTGETENGD